MGYFANGSEGDDYEAHYCARCRHGDVSEDALPCAVLDVHRLHNYADCNNRDSPLHVLIPRGPRGENLICRMFLAKDQS